MMMYLSLLSVVATFPLLTVAQEETPSYGVDVSFPMQHSRCREGPLGDRNAFYEKYVEGCVDYFKEEGERCIDYEIDRIKITLEQPGSMQNYTDTGFAKIKAPEDMFRVVKQFWEANKHHAEIGEDEPTGYTYINIWEKRTELVSIYDSGKNEGAGQALIDLISDTTRDILQEWTGMELRSVSTYGIRIYREGHVLATHADRVPLVTSAIINVDQDVDEPWPLEVYGHDGKAVNVTMEPGDMVLYESHSVLHGRPFPLKGRLFANIFVHFEPTGTKLRGDSVLHQLFRESERRNAARETKAYHELPSYLIPGTPEAEKWIKNRLMEEVSRGDCWWSMFLALPYFFEILLPYLCSTT
jgi:prolyl 4-hydroxylase